MGQIGRILNALVADGRWHRYLALAIAFAIGCGLLSWWQFSRRTETAEANALITANASAPAVPLTDLITSRTAWRPGLEWRTVEVQGGRLQGTTIEGREIPNVIDELPILAVLGALAGGQTIIKDAAELRVKETDRLSAIAANLRAMGGEVEEYDDGLVINGGRPLRGTRLPSYGDHRIAMAFAIAGLFAERLVAPTCLSTPPHALDEDDFAAVIPPAFELRVRAPSTLDRPGGVAESLVQDHLAAEPSLGRRFKLNEIVSEANVGLPLLLSSPNPLDGRGRLLTPSLLGSRPGE